MALLLVFHPLLRRLYETLYPISTTNSRASSKVNGGVQSYVSAADGEARMNQRASFDFGFAIAFLCALHGFSALKVLMILYINFCIATRISKRYVPATTWMFNIGILFANELCSGYKFANMVESIRHASVSSILEKTELHNWGTWLDSHGGIMPRWEILFNITILRLISFNLDRYWSLDGRTGSPLEVTIMNFQP
jgi:membrane-bound O-acyltransferase GUP1_2